MTDFKELRLLFKSLAEKAFSQGFYADFNYLEKFNLRYTKDKANTEYSKDVDKGIKMRIWDGEKYIEFSQSSLEKEDIEKNFEIIFQKAKEYDGTKTELKIDKTHLEKNFNANLEEIELEEMQKRLEFYKDKIMNYSQDIVNARALFMKKYDRHIFVNYYKNLSQIVPIFGFALIAFVNTPTGMKIKYEMFVDDNIDTIFDRAEKSFDDFTIDIENLKISKRLKGGKYKAILSPKITGLLAHESFGHGMEADTILKNRALAGEWIGKKIGEKNINIVDFPAIAGKHGHYHFDMEGNLAKKTYLVKSGIIQTPMSDVYSSTFLDYGQNNNARFESFDHKHYVRMSNTYFEQGEENYEDLISRVEDGILITDSDGGMEDPKGWGVQIQGCNGQRIKNGKLVNEFYDGFALTGFLPDLIKNISGISKNFEIEGGGHCGKGHKEWVRVSEGGPHLLIDEVILG
jgi:TldD protein